MRENTVQILIRHLEIDRLGRQQAVNRHLQFAIPVGHDLIQVAASLVRSTIRLGHQDPFRHLREIRHEASGTGRVGINVQVHRLTVRDRGIYKGQGLF